MQTDTPIIEQVRAALATWTTLHEQAEVAAATYADFKRLVGSNDAERKERKAQTPPEDYADYVGRLADTEHDHNAAKAAEERAEKALNVLREMLNNETAVIARAAGVTFEQGAERLFQTVDAYARTIAPAPALDDIRARLPRPVPVPAGICRDCRQPLTLDCHDDCVPF